jgi:hypothetical protein
MFIRSSRKASAAAVAAALPMRLTPLKAAAAALMPQAQSRSRQGKPFIISSALAGEEMLRAGILG